jgi:hypothetical protein
MKNTLLSLALAGLCLTTQSARAVTITVTADTLYEADGVTPLAMGSTVMVIADRDSDGFGNLTSANQASDTAFINDADDVILDRWALDGTGNTIRNIFFNLGDNGVNAGDPLILVWYAGLQENTNPTAPGQSRYFGTFRSDSGDDFGGSPWVVPGSNGDTISLNLLTEAIGGNQPEAEGRADQITFGPPPNIPPTAVCQNVVRAADASCSADVTADDVDGGSSDSDGSIVLKSLSPAGPYPVGTNSVTLTVTDDDGATGSCGALIIVADGTAPQITCPADITTPADSGSCSATVSFSATATDNCPGVSVSCTPPSGSIFTGTTNVNCTATDAAGNTDACSFSVTVVDNEPPTITCPSDITTDADSGQCTATVSFNPTASDSCGSATVVCVPPAGAFPVGTTAVTCTASDAGGNTAICSFNVTVVDNQDPSITCPADITTGTDAGQCSAVVTFAANASDNCPGVGVVCSPASGSTFNVGTTPVNCTATDASGRTANCTFNVTVSDDDAPVIACPANITTSADAGQCSASVSFTATGDDNCDASVTVNCSPAPGTFGVGTTTVNCSATDSAGNTGTCSFTVTVNDTEAPVVGCPADISTSADAGTCSATVSFSATVNDNCPGASVVCVPAAGSFSVGTTPVTCTATDASGNTAACSFNVTVADTENPSLACPADITTGTDAGQCSAVVTFAANASDNCPGVSVNCSPASGSAFPTGTTTVNCTATDASGNSVSCSFDVTVNDDDAPSITCPANVVTNVPSGTVSVIVNYAVPTVSDNCDASPTVNCSIPSGSSFAAGTTTTVTCTATDDAGNSSACSFTVTVNVGDDCNSIAELRQKVLDTDLPQSQKNSLLAHLDNAQDELDGGNCTKAVKQLEQFIKKVDRFERQHRLDAATAEALRDCAEAVIVALGC